MEEDIEAARGHSVDAILLFSLGHSLPLLPPLLLLLMLSLWSPALLLARS